MKPCRALAALLAYPDEDLIAALPEIRSQTGPSVAELLDELANENLLSLQERYVALFDRSRALSLHLFEHVHGESRERGQAMVDLLSLYEARGLQPAGHELPDYLPVFLEFLSLLPPSEAGALLRDTAHILRALGERLAERESAYAVVFDALLALAGEKEIRRKKRARVTPENLLALDREWREPEVTFGGPQPVHLYRNGVPA